MNIAVITGASAGIGRELVYAVDKDARYDEIWVIARRKERLEELRDKCTNPIRPIALDLSDLSSIDAYQALLEQEQPEIKMLVNAAGCGVFGPFAEADRKKLLASAQLNSLALTGMCHASLPYMHAGSSIINMGSNSAWQPVPYQAVYGASKSYVLSLSRAIGRELRPQGIHVMCVCPGWIKTEFQRVAHHDEYIRYVDKCRPCRISRRKRASPFSATRCAVRCAWSSSCRWTPSWTSGANSRGSSKLLHAFQRTEDVRRENGQSGSTACGHFAA